MTKMLAMDSTVYQLLVSSLNASNINYNSLKAM
jgi:hypothetical protein